MFQEEMDGSAKFLKCSNIATEGWSEILTRNSQRTSDSVGWNLHTLNCQRCDASLTGPFGVIGQSTNWVVHRSANSRISNPAGSQSKRVWNVYPYAVVALLWVLIPAVWWCWWMTSGTFTDRYFGTAPKIFGLHWQIALAATWLFFGPYIIYVWENLLSSTLCRINDTRGIDRWETARITRIASWARRSFWPFSLSLSAFGVAWYVVVLHWSDSLFHVPDHKLWWHVTGGVLVAWQAFTFGIGIWIMFLAISSAVILPSRSLRWYPFRDRQIDGIEALSKFAFWSAFFLLLSGPWFPMALVLLRTLPLDTRIVSLLLVFSILIAGLLTFLLPTYILVRFVRQKKDHALHEVSVQLEALHWDDPHALRSAKHQGEIELLLATWSAISSARAVPRRILIAGQVSVLVILPLIEGLIIAKLL